MIKIQKLVRGHLSRKHTRKIRAVTEATVLKLQRGFRGMAARERRSRLLWERDMNNRRMEISSMAADHEYESRLVRRLRKKAKRRNYDEQ